MMVTIQLVNKFDRLRDSIHGYAEEMDNMQSASYLALLFYRNLTGGDNLRRDSSSVESAIDLLDDWQPRIYNLGDAMWAASLVGILVALTIHSISWLVLLLDFRSSALKMRRGIYDFAPKAKPQLVLYVTCVEHPLRALDLFDASDAADRLGVRRVTHVNA